MKDLLILIPKKGKSAEVKVNYKGRDLLKFKADRINFLVYKKDTNEVFMFNKFTGSQIRNYYDKEKSWTYKPGSFKKTFKTKGTIVVKELDLLMKNLEERDLISLAFLDRMDNDFKKVFPEIVEAAVLEHKKRFN